MKLEGELREIFMENEGRKHAKSEYYTGVEQAFESLLNFKPLTALQIDKVADYPAFFRGYKEVKDYRALIAAIAGKAQAENSMILKLVLE